VRETDAKAREAAERAAASRQAIQEVGALASQAQSRADAAHDVEARLSQRLADRNRYRALDERSILFDFGQAKIRPDDVPQLEEVAAALKADPNAVAELQGFADPRGTDRVNAELARERVEAVVRHLVQRHGIELRQLRAAAMGTAALAPGEAPSAEAFAKARRVDIRLFTPWSSWEDRQAADVESSDTAGAASPPTSGEPARPAPASTPLETPGTEDAWRGIVHGITPQHLGGRD
jgi:outer membrane protein OmpA-like peptidoglycan-associated protein